MPKKKEKTYEEGIEEFVTQMRNAGVTDKTIKKALQEINDYQEKQAKIMMAEAFERFRKIVKENMENDETI